MRCPKSVTPKKIAANRENAKRSTGPRTARGKCASKFNAVTIGLFTRHIIIPVCDGYDGEAKFQSLLDELHQQFQPVAFYEEWLVLQIAQCMWRIPRALQCESGSFRESLFSMSNPDYELEMFERRERMDQLFMEIATLTQAEEQLQNCATFSQEIYEKIAPLVEKGKNHATQSENGSNWVQPEFDHQLLVTRIRERKNALLSRCKIEEKQFEARLDYHALPEADDMDRVFRYEEKMRRQIDWAVQRLLESQERRTASRSSPDLIPIGQK